MRFISIGYCIFFSATALADISVQFPDNSTETPQQYYQLECVDNNTQGCIDDQCLDSEDIDCEGNCEQMSQSVCQQQNTN